MGKYTKLQERILAGSSDNNIAFVNLCQLLYRLGFVERIKGDHHIFIRDDVEEIINIQPKRHKAKPYQVKQIRRIRCRLSMADGETYRAVSVCLNGVNLIGYWINHNITLIKTLTKHWRKFPYYLG